MCPIDVRDGRKTSLCMTFEILLKFICSILNSRGASRCFCCLVFCFFGGVFVFSFDGVRIFCGDSLTFTRELFVSVDEAASVETDGFVAGT